MEMTIVAKEADAFTFALTVTPETDLSEFPFALLERMDAEMYRVGAGSTSTRQKITAMMDRKDPFNARIDAWRGRR